MAIDGKEDDASAEFTSGHRIWVPQTLFCFASFAQNPPAANAFIEDRSLSVQTRGEEAISTSWQAIRFPIHRHFSATAPSTSNLAFAAAAAAAAATARRPFASRSSHFAHGKKNGDHQDAAGHGWHPVNRRHGHRHRQAPPRDGLRCRDELPRPKVSRTTLPDSWEQHETPKLRM